MTDPNTDPSVDPRDAPPRGGEAKKVPPLVWIIIGLLLLFAVVAVSQCDGMHTTPGGGQTPAKVDDAVMPEPAVNTPLTPPPTAAPANAPPAQ